MLNNLKISGKLAASFALIISVMTVTGVTVTANLNELKETSSLTRQSYQAMEKIALSNKALIDAETGMRKYRRLGVGSESELEFYRASIAIFDESFRAGRALGSHDSAQEARMERIRTLSEQWKAEVALPAIQRVADLSTRDADLNMIQNGRGKELIEAIVRQVDEVTRRERELLNDRIREENTASDTARITIIITTLLSLLIAGGSVFLLNHGIAKPLRDVAERMKRLSSVRKTDNRRHDEVGVVQAAADSVEHAVLEVGRALQAMAAGDMTYRITESYGGIMDDLCQNANETAEKLAGTVSSIRETAIAVTGSASEIAAGSSDLSARTEQQASALQETAASMEELATTVKNNADNAQQANLLASEAHTSANDGGEVAKQAIDAMRRIEDSSKRISDIIGVIDDIAFRTGILALNAAVEAARAGDAGKGFAVVAAEVRALAQRSSDASKEVKFLIEGSSQQVNEGVGLVQKAGDTLVKIVASVQRVARIVGDIASASAEQASSVDQVNDAVSSMDEMTQKNAALVEESAASALTLEQKAREMSDLVGNFNVGDISAATPKRSGKSGATRASNVTNPTPKEPIRSASERRKAAEQDEAWKEF
jgi:methyl-accepting chemotaxis protein